jgi:anti-sigma factor RsiW
MNCPEVKERLNDYVDATLPENERESLLAHLAVCAACRREAGLLRELLERAGALDREIMPREDLWKGIAQRIAHSGRPSRRRRPRVLAASVAAVLLLIAAAVTISQLTPGTISEKTAANADLARNSEEAMDACARARAGLLDSLDREKETLDPDIAASVRGDLLVFDSAVSEIRSALNADPGNERLRQMLVMVCEKQDGLIAQIARLAGSA